MKFQTLRLTGFKSFTDPTELLLAPGLTGVVGPNGCGKSNILEAMRWVMGESSAKSMRGSGMEDVIFAGASGRAPRGFAEVSLLIDNGERRAPPQFNDAETLEVSRRITRNAGSVFRVNGKETRARDVRVLFADAATGAQSPALVRQGQIGVLIAAKPQGRRKILEDAAGVSGLYERRREVEQRLKAAEENLTRVDDVLARLDSQIGGLRRQARQAERYASLTETIRDASAMLVWLRYREARERAGSALEALHTARRSVSATTAARNAATEAHELAEAGLAPLREEAAIARTLEQRLLARREALAAETRRAEETLARLDADLKRARGDLQREAELAEDAATAIAALEAEQVGLGAGNTHAEDIAAAASELAEAAERVTLAEAERDRLAEAAATGSAQRDAVLREQEAARRALSEAQSRLSARETAQETLRTALSGAQATLDAAEAAAEAACAATNGLDDRLAAQESARIAAETAAGDARSEVGAARAEFGALEAERDALQRAIEADAKAAPGDAVLNHVQVAPGYEAALAAALGDEASAAPAPAFSEKLRGWLALKLLAHTPDAGEPLSTRVKAPDALARRVAATAVVSRDQGPAAQAKLKPGQRLVSPEGDLWRWDGYFAGAAASGAGATAARLQRQNRRAELEAAVETARATLDMAEAAFAGARETEIRSREAEATARSEAQQLRDAKAAALRQRADAEAACARNRKAEQEAGADLAALRETEARARARLDAAERQVADVADPAALRAAAEAARATLAERREVLEAARARHAQLDSAATRRSTRIESIAKELEGWRRRAETAASRRADLASRIERNEEERARAADAPEQARAAEAGLDVEAREIATRVTAATDALSTQEAELARLTGAERDANAALATAREALARAEAHEEGAAARLAEAESALREETGAGPDALEQRFAEASGSVAELEAGLAKARADRDRLGAVNLRAAIEIEEAQSERDTLGSEKADLEQAIAKLRSGLAALNREGRERLLAAFEQVNRHFRALFVTLFGGGEAELRLTESDDPLEAGLEIFCQPPGKRLQTLSLLSGGEQTLTALALIFAVFLVNPAPVCVLDEVDAPLDDANVGRFCDLLDAMTERTETRFLIITHHSVTMSRMDRLFGVTMIEKGVSRLVSVDLGRAVELVEAEIAAE